MSSESSSIDAVVFPANPATAAIRLLELGFTPIPANTETKATSVKWDGWSEKVSGPLIRAHWALNPHNGVGVIVGDNFVFFDADSPASIATLEAAEAKHGVSPSMAYKTPKGVHHVYRLEHGTKARTSTHCTAANPDLVDVKTGRTMVIVPPSPGRVLTKLTANHARDFTPAPQGLINDLGGGVPDAPVPLGATVGYQEAAAPPTPLAVLAACVHRLDPDLSRADWFRVAAVLHRETAGSVEGYKLFDAWSAGGKKYKGVRDTDLVWKSIKTGHAKPATMGSLRFMLREAGHDWYDILADAAPGLDPQAS